MESQGRDGEAFDRFVTGAQAELFSFIALLVGNTPDAWDVLQNTNLALMKKAGQYDPDRPFGAWARSVAYYEVLTFRARQRRERLVFDDEMLDRVSATLLRDDEEDEESAGRRDAALERCLGKLLPAQRELVVRRYQGRASVGALARERSVSETCVSTWLYRIRRLLADCIRKELGREAFT
jgi:RNA polymerase sigma-70 factor (ECF subfamily)